MVYPFPNGTRLQPGKLRRDWLNEFTPPPTHRSRYLPHRLQCENDFTYELSLQSYEKEGKEMDNVKVKLNGIGYPQRMKHLYKVVMSERSARGVLAVNRLRSNVHGHTFPHKRDRLKQAYLHGGLSCEVVGRDESHVVSEDIHRYCIINEGSDKWTPKIEELFLRADLEGMLTSDDVDPTNEASSRGNVQERHFYAAASYKYEEVALHRTADIDPAELFSPCCKNMDNTEWQNRSAVCSELMDVVTKDAFNEEWNNDDARLDMFARKIHPKNKFEAAYSGFTDDNTGLDLDVLDMDDDEFLKKYGHGKDMWADMPDLLPDASISFGLGHVVVPHLDLPNCTSMNFNGVFVLWDTVYCPQRKRMIRIVLILTSRQSCHVAYNKANRESVHIKEAKSYFDAKKNELGNISSAMIPDEPNCDSHGLLATQPHWNKLAGFYSLLVWVVRDYLHPIGTTKEMLIEIETSLIKCNSNKIAFLSLERLICGSESTLMNPNIIPGEHVPPDFGRWPEGGYLLLRLETIIQELGGNNGQYPRFQPTWNKAVRRSVTIQHCRKLLEVSEQSRSASISAESYKRLFTDLTSVSLMGPLVSQHALGISAGSHLIDPAFCQFARACKGTATYKKYKKDLGLKNESECNSLLKSFKMLFTTIGCLMLAENFGCEWLRFLDGVVGRYYDIRHCRQKVYFLAYADTVDDGKVLVLKEMDKDGKVSVCKELIWPSSEGDRGQPWWKQGYMDNQSESSDSFGKAVYKLNKNHSLHSGSSAPRRQRKGTSKKVIIYAEPPQYSSIGDAAELPKHVIVVGVTPGAKTMALAQKLARKVEKELAEEIGGDVVRNINPALLEDGRVDYDDPESYGYYSDDASDSGDDTFRSSVSKRSIMAAMGSVTSTRFIDPLRGPNAHAIFTAPLDNLVKQTIYFNQFKALLCRDVSQHSFMYSDLLSQSEKRSLRTKIREAKLTDFVKTEKVFTETTGTHWISTLKYDDLPEIGSFSSLRSRYEHMAEYSHLPDGTSAVIYRERVFSVDAVLFEAMMSLNLIKGWAKSLLTNKQYVVLRRPDKGKTVNNARNNAQLTLFRADGKVLLASYNLETNEHKSSMFLCKDWEMKHWEMKTSRAKKNKKNKRKMRRITNSTINNDND